MGNNPIWGNYSTGIRPLSFGNIGINVEYEKGRMHRQQRDTNYVRIGRIEHKGIMTLQDSGNVNMLEPDSVIYFARKLGLIETAEWVSANRELYIKGIMKGFFYDYKE